MPKNTFIEEREEVEFVRLSDQKPLQHIASKSAGPNVAANVMLP